MKLKIEVFLVFSQLYENMQLLQFKSSTYAKRILRFEVRIQFPVNDPFQARCVCYTSYLIYFFLNVYSRGKRVCLLQKKTCLPSFLKLMDGVFCRKLEFLVWTEQGANVTGKVPLIVYNGAQVRLIYTFWSSLTFNSSIQERPLQLSQHFEILLDYLLSCHFTNISNYFDIVCY